MKEQQLRKRNFISLTLEGTFFLTALAFLDANAVVPVFIDTFTGSLQLAGLATTLRTALSMLTQLLSGPYVPKIKNVPAYILWIMFLFRPLPFIMVPVLLGNLNPFLTVGIFLAIYGLFWASDGLVVIPWSDLLGRTIPANKRGKLMGYQQVTGGIAALGAGFLIKMILAHPNLENLVKYAIIFSGAGVSLMISSIMMSFARDLPRKLSKEKVSFKRYFSQMPHYLLKNRDFASLTVIRIIYSFIGMVSPFIILFGKSAFQLSPSQVSNLIYIQIIGNLLGGLLWGTVSHRWGNKYVILIAQLIGAFIPILAFTSLIFNGLILPIFFLWPMTLLTGINMGSWMGFLNYTIDIVKEEERPIYLVLGNLTTFPLTFLPYLAGSIADRWGFLPLFLISLLAAAAGTVLSMRLNTPQISSSEESGH
ncbi:MAG: MFS transporter [Clostridia bacterium]|jgi:MFS family permease